MSTPLRLRLDAEQMRRGLDEIRSRWQALRGETKEGVDATGEAEEQFDATAEAAKNLNTAFSLIRWGAVAAGLNSLLNISRDFESGQQALVVATGASGAALQALNADARAVFAGVPETIQEVSVVLGELDTRVDGSRDQIRELTKDVLDFARVSGTDAAATARDVGQLLNAIGGNAADARPLLDQLTFAAQATGVGVNSIARSIIEAGPAFVEMGFSVERQIALFSEFERVGARPQEVIGSLNIALTRLAQSGATDAEAAFVSMLREIEEAPTLLEAVTISSELFGSRVGGKVAEDIREGRFAVDGFVEALKGAARQRSHR